MNLLVYSFHGRIILYCAYYVHILYITVINGGVTERIKEHCVFWVSFWMHSKNVRTFILVTSMVVAFSGLGYHEFPDRFVVLVAALILFSSSI